MCLTSCVQGIVDALVRSGGADVNACDALSNSALHFAARRGHGYATQSTRTCVCILHQHISCFTCMLHTPHNLSILYTYVCVYCSSMLCYTQHINPIWIIAAWTWSSPRTLTKASCVVCMHVWVQLLHCEYAALIRWHVSMHMYVWSYHHPATLWTCCSQQCICICMCDYNIIQPHCGHVALSRCHVCVHMYMYNCVRFEYIKLHRAQQAPCICAYVCVYMYMSVCLYQ